MLNLHGRFFGRLEVLSFHGKNKQRASLWLCSCLCGKTTVVRGALLTSGHTKSCGCLGRERRNSAAQKALTKHGKSHTKIHNTWLGMINRCGDKKNSRWKDYGGRGIRVCIRWHDFRHFLTDMGEPPTPKHQIDRIDNNGDYTPKNCRWATTKQQCRNTRVNHLITHNGKTQCLTEWAEETGIGLATIWARLKIYGWPVELALTKCP